MILVSRTLLLHMTSFEKRHQSSQMPAPKYISILTPSLMSLNFEKYLPISMLVLKVRNSVRRRSEKYVFGNKAMPFTKNPLTLILSSYHRLRITPRVLKEIGYLDGSLSLIKKTKLLTIMQNSTHLNCLRELRILL